MAAPRVLQAPGDVAGQLTLAAHGLREIGVPATSFSRAHPFGYRIGPDVTPTSRPSWLLHAARELLRHDVLHLHFGQSFLPEAADGWDARLFRRFGGAVVMEFHGSDIRIPEVEYARNPYYVPQEMENEPDATARLRRWSAITEGHAIISDHQLRAFAEPWFPHLHTVPLRVDTRAFEPSPPAVDARRPLVVHAPSDLAVKGTAHVRDAVATLRDAGVAFEYEEISGMSNDEVLALTSRADLVIDQLCLGAHGVFAIEAWCLGKPVIGNIADEFAAAADPDLPVIRASPDDIVDVLGRWLERGEDRQRVGRASRAYAERVHDVRRVAPRLVDVYAQLPGRRTARRRGRTA